MHPMEDPHVQVPIETMTERQLLVYIATTVRQILHSTTQIEAEETQIMADLTAITAAVQESTSIEEGAIVLLNQLGDLIRQNATDQEALNALADQIDAEADSLAAAVTANTPAG